ncbi:MAG: efflux RND transporter periplasmic adaptor subunit [Bacteroidetes bacterium]|nr:efflux RND transporter periplasmic adaptor subunit [Bacteroidota bacterium]
MSTKKIIIILSALVLILLVFSKLKGGKSKGIKVAIEKVSLQNIQEEVSASGTIYPENEVKISSDISGEIIDLMVNEGDSVKKGQLLVKINPDIYQTQLDQAKAGLNNAKASSENIKAQLLSSKANAEMQSKNFEMQSKLYKDKVISQQEFNTSEAQYDMASAQYEAAQKQADAAFYNTQSVEASVQQAGKNYGRTSVYSPADGVVTGLNSKKGERVVGTAQMAGTEMMRISNLRRMEVRVDVNENDIVHIKLGDTAGIEVDAYQGKVFKGIVTQVANSAKNNATTTSTDQVTKFEVKVLILEESYKDVMADNGGRIPFRPGMSASVHIYTKTEKQVLAIPVASVTLKEKKDNVDEKEEIVFVISNGKVIKRVVKTGIQDTKNIKVIEGLKEGEQVVSAPFDAINNKLNDGMAVDIVAKEILYEVKE